MHDQAIRARRAESNAAIAAQDVDRVIAVMLPEVSVSVAGGPMLTERGRWTGRWRSSAGEEVMRGNYIAEWRHTDMGWFIESEVFVSTERER